MPQCPECGIDLDGINIEAHANEHYPESHLRRMESEGDSRHYGEARKRQAALMDMARQQNAPPPPQQPQSQGGF